MERLDEVCHLQSKSRKDNSLCENFNDMAEVCCWYGFQSLWWKYIRQMGNFILMIISTTYAAVFNRVLRPIKELM